MSQSAKTKIKFADFFQNHVSYNAIQQIWEQCISSPHFFFPLKLPWISSFVCCWSLKSWEVIW